MRSTLLSLLVLGSTIAGCGVTRDDTVVRLDNIVRVLENSGSYTVYVQKPGTTDLERMMLFTAEHPCSDFPRELSVDALEDDPIWAEYGVREGWKCLVKLHLHAPQDINGGFWDSGKFGNGQIHVVE